MKKNRGKHHFLPKIKQALKTPAPKNASKNSNAAMNGMFVANDRMKPIQHVMNHDHISSVFLPNL